MTVEGETGTYILGDMGDRWGRTSLSRETKLRVDLRGSELHSQTGVGQLLGSPQQGAAREAREG